MPFALPNGLRTGVEEFVEFPAGRVEGALLGFRDARVERRPAFLRDQLLDGHCRRQLLELGVILAATDQFPANQPSGLTSPRPRGPPSAATTLGYTPPAGRTPAHSIRLPPAVQLPPLPFAALPPPRLRLLRRHHVVTPQSNQFTDQTHSRLRYARGTERRRVTTYSRPTATSRKQRTAWTEPARNGQRPVVYALLRNRGADVSGRASS